MNQKIIVKGSHNLRILPKDKLIDTKMVQAFCYLFSIVPIKTRYPLMKDFRTHVYAGPQ